MMRHWMLLLCLCSSSVAAPPGKRPRTESCLVQTDSFKGTVTECDGALEKLSDLASVAAPRGAHFGAVNLAELLLARSGIFDTQLNLQNVHICSKHRSSLGPDWMKKEENRPKFRKGTQNILRCNMPAFLRGYPYAEHNNRYVPTVHESVAVDQAKAIWQQLLVFVPPGTAMCRNHAKYVAQLKDRNDALDEEGDAAAAEPEAQKSSETSPGQSVSYYETYIQKLKMLLTFSTTNVTKLGRFISPIGMYEPIPLWAIAAAAIPALLVDVLIFVEVEITELLLSTKERGLRKGGGFHFDLVLAGIVAVACGLLGLPWMWAAAVQSLAHASSLTIMKRKAPGERPEVDIVLEQRVTTIGVALLTGACAFLGSWLQEVPMAALFGIFHYLGIISMLGVQFLQRIILIFVPQKYHPDVLYCKLVRLRKMHLYTLLQLACLVILWIVKSIKLTFLAFPFILMLVAVARQLLLPKSFDEKQLNALDGHDEHEDHEHNEVEDHDFYQEAILPM